MNKFSEDLQAYMYLMYACNFLTEVLEKSYRY